jgi:hypothetical protein
LNHGSSRRSFSCSNIFTSVWAVQHGANIAQATPLSNADVVTGGAQN